MTTDYAPPVDRLLTYGDCRDLRKWPDYLELGLTQEHVPELIRMAIDDDLNWADSDSLEVWAPIHAWRALGQLREEKAIEPLMDLFHELEDSDWVGEELPVVYGMIGPKAIPQLATYLSDASYDVWARIAAAYSLERVGTMNPEARDECVSVFTEQLERFDENEPELNGFLISYLVDLNAVESIASIGAAFEKDCVDFMIMGDLEDVEIALGLREERSDPPTYPSLAEKLSPPPVAVPNRYVSTYVRGESKVGRNDPCPCGSGKKYKKCCLQKDQTK